MAETSVVGIFDIWLGTSEVYVIKLGLEFKITGSHIKTLTLSVIYIFFQFFFLQAFSYISQYTLSKFGYQQHFTSLENYVSE